MTTEELVACMVLRGLSVADMDQFTIGMLLNFAFAYNRIRKLANGEDAPDVDARYKQLKAIAPIVEERYRNGQITKEKYDEYRKSLERYGGD